MNDPRLIDKIVFQKFVSGYKKLFRQLGLTCGQLVINGKPRYFIHHMEMAEEVLKQELGVHFDPNDRAYKKLISTIKAAGIASDFAEIARLIEQYPPFPLLSVNDITFQFCKVAQCKTPHQHVHMHHQEHIMPHPIGSVENGFLVLNMNVNLDKITALQAVVLSQRLAKMGLVLTTREEIAAFEKRTAN